MKIYSDSTLEDMAGGILRKYQDQDFSFTDAVSFSVMEYYGIKQAFSLHILERGISVTKTAFEVGTWLGSRLG